MKKIEALIPPQKIESVKNALIKIGIRRMTISKIEEFGRQEGHKEFYRGEEYMIDVVKEFKIELMVATDQVLSRVIEAIENITKTQTVGDEEIFVSPLEEVTRLRHTS